MGLPFCKYHLVAAAQCEDVTAALEAAKRPGARVAEPVTPTSKLQAAALHDNDRFLAAEGDQQQLLLRCDLPAAVCGHKRAELRCTDPHCSAEPGTSVFTCNIKGTRMVSGRLQMRGCAARRRQDDELDQLGRHVERIGQVGLQIHEELEVQGAMLTELDEDVEGAQSRLAAAQKKMAGVLKRMGMRGQLCIMGVLLIILVILVAILFS